MREFLLKVSRFLIWSLVSFFILGKIFVAFLPSFSALIMPHQDWLETSVRLNIASRGEIQDTLIIGCSVGAQIASLDENNNHLTYVGSTLSIGNYFLVKAALESSDDISVVIYYTVPNVLGYSLERRGTHKFFVKPFYSFNTRNEILSDKFTAKILRKNKLLDFYLLDAWKLLPFDDFDYNSKSSIPEFVFSKDALRWVDKLDSLCDSHNVEFYLISPPLPEVIRDLSNDWTENKELVKSHSNKLLYKEYFESVDYYANEYSDDSLHMNRAWRDENKKRLYGEMMYRIKSSKRFNMNESE